MYYLGFSTETQPLGGVNYIQKLAHIIMEAGKFKIFWKDRAGRLGPREEPLLLFKSKECLLAELSLVYGEEVVTLLFYLTD